MDASVQKTFSRVIATNPDIPQEELRILVSRDPWPNAACHGEGTIVINIGLLSRLENESQLAFIICHEMAHYVQNHVSNKIKERINYLYSKETQAELKKIYKSDFGKYERIQKMFGAALYSSRRHDRSRELEADSIAVYFLQNTPYDITEAVNTLKLLDTIDKPKYLTSLDFKKYFDFAEFPFKSKWIEENKSEFLKGNLYQIWEIDSLKTHPSCQKRFDAIQHFASPDNGKGKPTLPSFSQMVQFAEFEMIESYFFQKNFGRCLHECLQYLEVFPNNAYLHARVVICLHHIWAAKIDHEMGKHVSLPDEEQTPSYHQMVTMLYNMSMSDYKKLAYHYSEKIKSTYLTDEHFLYASYLSAKMMDNAEKMKACKWSYIKLFPEGQYMSKLTIE